MSVLNCGLFALVAMCFKKQTFWDTPGRLANGHRRSGGACFLRFQGLLDYIGYENGERQALRHVGNYIYQSTLRRVLLYLNIHRHHCQNVRRRSFCSCLVI